MNLSSLRLASSPRSREDIYALFELYQSAARLPSQRESIELVCWAVLFREWLTQLYLGKSSLSALHISDIDPWKRNSFDMAKLKLELVVLIFEERLAMSAAISSLDPTTVSLILRFSEPTISSAQWRSYCFNKLESLKQLQYKLEPQVHARAQLWPISAAEVFEVLSPKVRVGEELSRLVEAMQMFSLKTS